MTTYLIRHKGRYFLCRPGAIDWRVDDAWEGGIRLAWLDRDTGGVICFDGDADDIRTLTDDE